MSQDFVVRNGLIVNNFILYANSSTARVGVNNTNPDASLSVTGTANVSANVALGDHLKFAANLVVNSSTIFLGNSIANLVVNATNYASQNATHSLALSRDTIQIGNSTVFATVNSTVANVDVGRFAVSANVGANVSLSTTSLLIGNTTVNLAMNSTNFSFNPNSTTTFAVNTTTAIININSTDAALRIVQRGAGDAIVVEDVASDITRFSVDQFGRTVIGHTGVMPMVGSGGSFTLSLHSNAGLGINPYVAAYGWGARPALVTQYSNNSIIGDKDTAPLLPASGTVISDWLNYVHTDVNTAVLSSRVRFAVDGTANTTTIPTAFNIFLQNATSTTLASRLFLAANGNLGLGSTAPTDAVHAVGNVFATVGLKAGANVSLTTTTLSIGNTTVNLAANSTNFSFNPNSTTTFVVNTTMAFLNISATDTALKITNRGAGNSFVVEDIASDASPFVIDGAGRVIIGANVGYSMVGIGTIPFFHTHGNTTATSSRATYSWGQGFSDYIFFSNNTTISDKDTVPTLPPTSTVLYSMLGRVHTDVNTAVGNFNMRFQVDGTANTTTIPTAFNIFLQNATSTTLGSRLFLAANGNLGLSTTTPTDALHAVGNVFATVGLKAGANVSLTTTTLSIGNSTANLLGNSVLLSLENIATGRVNVSPTSIRMGSPSAAPSGETWSDIANNGIHIGNSSVNTLVNSTSITTGNGIFSTGVGVGANVSLSTTSLLIGNTTANLLGNSVQVLVQNSTGTSLFAPGVINVGANVSMNSTTISAELTVLTNQVFVGAFPGVGTISGSLANNRLHIGNSSVNTLVNSTSITTGNGIFSTGVGVGDNVSMNTSAIFVGNSTVNSVTNSLSRSWTMLSRTTVAANVATVEQTIVNTDWDQLMILFNKVSGSLASTLNIALANSTANILTITADTNTLAARFMSGKAEILTAARAHYMTFQGVTEQTAAVANTIGYSGAGIIKQAISVDVSVPTKIIVAFTTGDVDSGTISFYGIKAG